MRILIVTPWIRLGGADILAVELANSLKKRGHKIKIATLFTDFENLPEDSKNIEYVKPGKLVSGLCHKSRLFFFLAGPIFLFINTLKSAGWADIINPHNFPSLWISVFAGLIKHKKVVWTCNEPPPYPRLRDVSVIGLPDYIGWMFASSILDKMIVRSFNGPIIVPSEKTYKEVRQRYGKIASVINISVDYNFFAAGRKKKRILDVDFENNYVIVCVGKLHPQKNQILTIDTVKLLINKIPNLKLLLIGEGPAKKQIQDYIKENSLDNYVSLLGFVSRNNLRDIYKSSRVNLFPAIDHQSWGFTPLEALSGGIPSVISAESGVSEVFGKYGFGIVVKPTAVGFSNAVLNIKNNKNHWRSMVAKGNLYVKRRLSWDYYATQYEKIFLRG